jgi:hypothetical protein
MTITLERREGAYGHSGQGLASVAARGGKA